MLHVEAAYKMPPTVLILGFDALETTLVDRWADEGYAALVRPTVRERGDLCARQRRRLPAGYPLGRLDLQDEARQPQGSTGSRSRSTLGRPGCGQTRPTTFRVLTPFWQYAGDAGRRVVVIDAAYAPPATGLNGVLLRDWGAHSAGFGRGSDPSGYVDEVVDRYGDYPLPHGVLRGRGARLGVRRPRRIASVRSRTSRSGLAEAVALKTRVVLGELERAGRGPRLRGLSRRTLRRAPALAFHGREVALVRA